MQIYLRKVQYILPVFSAIAFLSVVILTLIHWKFFLANPLIDLKEEYWDFWIPLIFPWIPILIWQRPKMKRFTFKKDNSNARFVYHLITWITTMVMLMFAQQLLITATGKLVELQNINGIDQQEKARYYHLEQFVVAPFYGGSAADFSTSGKFNGQLNFEIYFVNPILIDSSQRPGTNHRYWYGVKYHKQISNRSSDETKDKKFREFYDECLQKMISYNFYDLDHFERTPYSNDRDIYFKAIESRIQHTPGSEYIVLEPVKESYANRNGNKLTWIFIIFFIGSVILLLVLIPARFQDIKSDL